MFKQIKKKRKQNSNSAQSADCLLSNVSNSATFNCERIKNVRMDQAECGRNCVSDDKDDAHEGRELDDPPDVQSERVHGAWQNGKWLLFNRQVM
jgi:hypothetical protein